MPLNYRSVSSLTKVRPSPCLCVCLCLLERAGQRLSAVGCLLGPRVQEGYWRWGGEGVTRVKLFVFSVSNGKGSA